MKKHKKKKTLVWVIIVGMFMTPLAIATFFLGEEILSPVKDNVFVQILVVIGLVIVVAIVFFGYYLSHNNPKIKEKISQLEKRIKE